MRPTKSGRSKRKLEDTQFAEVSSGPTSRLLPDDGLDKHEMETALSRAGFDIEEGKIGDAELLKLYKRHVFERSKARKQNQNATPYDELDDAKIRSMRSRKRSNLGKGKTHNEKESLLSPKRKRSSLRKKFCYASSQRDPILPAIEQQNPSTGPVRTRRSTRISAANGGSVIQEEEVNATKIYHKKKLCKTQSPYSRPNTRSQRNLGKKKTTCQTSENLVSHKNTTSPIPESLTNLNDPFQSESDIEPAGTEDRREKRVDRITENKISGNPLPNQLRRKFTTAPSNPLGLRVSRPACFPTPPRPAARSQKRHKTLDSESGTDDGSGDEVDSEGYLPTSDIDSDEDFLEPLPSKNQTRIRPQRKSASSKPKSYDSKSTSKPKRSKAKFSQQRALYLSKLSSSEADIELPPKCKKKLHSLPRCPESSEDTPDLHEPSNFRTSRIKTRLQRSICSAVNINLESPENSDDDTSDPVFIPGKKRWKGKGRALDTDELAEQEDDSLMLSGRGIREGSSLNPDVLGEDEIEEEWDAGDLFGEKHTHTEAYSNISPDLNPANPNRTTDTSPQQNGPEDFQKALALLKAVCTGDSTKAKQIKKQVEVLSNMLDTYMNNTPSTAEQRDRVVSRSTGEDSSNSKGSPSLTPRTARIRALIKVLIRTLYGLKRGEKLVPSGASPAEKRSWMVNISLHELLNKANNNPVSIEDPVPSTGDPCFPYPNGPGGEKASRTSLKIMWDVMHSVGVRTFRPDFSDSLSSPGNMFLFRMATVILIKLVKSGEYSDISSNDLEPKTVLKLIVAHVRGTWARYFREQRKWSQERLASRDKRRVQKARVNSVREGRLAYVMSHKSLWPLAKVIQDCCSDDETDYEDEEGRKYCKVRIIRWRSSQLDMIFEAIDAARFRNNSIKSQPGNNHRTRTRSHNNPISDLLPPEQIYKDCISPAYYDELKPWEKEDIKIINQSILTTIKDMIKKRLLPTAV
ncbi:hypothetical protein DFH28DRAFT_924566 [Melampsora americana]|nr:hypothetical protein DFH28DRAFT_924566 [Melampsora americana]